MEKSEVMAAVGSRKGTSLQSIYSFYETPKNCSTEFRTYGASDTSADDEDDEFQDKIKRGSFVSSENFQRPDFCYFRDVTIITRCSCTKKYLDSWTLEASYNAVR